MEIDGAAALSLTGALVSVAAAIYSRWSARATAHANEIALHDPRFKVYSGVQRFAHALTTKGASIPEDELWQCRSTVDLAEFYFDEAIQAELKAHFGEAIKMMAANDECEHAREEKKPELAELSKKRSELHRSVRDGLLDTIGRMKQPLKVYSKASRFV